MNNSVKKCCVCNNEKTGGFITIKDNKYHLCCIEDLKENCEDLFNQKEMMFKNMQLNQLKTCKLAGVLKELKTWLEEEKNRLAKECSQIYEDSLGKTRLVNEDIFDEVNRIILKLNELQGGKNE